MNSMTFAQGMIDVNIAKTEKVTANQTDWRLFFFFDLLIPLFKRLFDDSLLARSKRIHSIPKRIIKCHSLELVLYKNFL